MTLHCLFSEKTKERGATIAGEVQYPLTRVQQTGGRPLFTLESAIKIISDEKGWTHGGEKGAQNYIDNLGSKKGSYISEWERESLKSFFAAVRNPFGHGPGSDEMPKLTGQQTDWAIEPCMSWIKSLVKRM